MCARGMLLADVSFDFVHSLIAVADPTTWQSVAQLFVGMRDEASAWLERERVEAVDRGYHHFIDARYQGQNFEVVVAIDEPDADDYAAFLERFAEAHERAYGYAIPDKPVEIVNCRLQAIGRVPKAPLTEWTQRESARAEKRRRVYFGSNQGWLDAPIYARGTLGADLAIEGPAIIEEMSSTVVLAPGEGAVVDRIGNLIVRVNAPHAVADRSVEPGQTLHE